MYVAVRFLRHRTIDVVREIKGLGYAAAVQGMKRSAAMEKTDTASQ